MPSVKDARHPQSGRLHASCVRSGGSGRALGGQTRDGLRSGRIGGPLRHLPAGEKPDARQAAGSGACVRRPLSADEGSHGGGGAKPFARYTAPCRRWFQVKDWCRISRCWMPSPPFFFARLPCRPWFSESPPPRITVARRFVRSIPAPGTGRSPAAVAVSGSRKLGVSEGRSAAGVGPCRPSLATRKAAGPK